MTDPGPPARGASHADARAFILAFAAHAGRGGVGAVALVAAGALLEGVGLALLVPIIGLILAPDETGGWVAGLIGGDATGRLTLLLVGFLGVMILRALVLRWRDLALFELQNRFTLRLRSNLVGALAEAPWERLARVEHARVTSLLMADIGRIGSAAHFLVQSAVSVAMLAIQLLVALALAPLFALFALGGLAAATILVRRASPNSAVLGRRIVEANRGLMGSASGFLGGLKASAAQGASARFADEFDAAQRGAAAEQRRFMRSQTNSRTLLSIATALAAAGVVAGGVLAGVSAPVLIALIVIFARMAPLAIQLQQGAQQLIYNGASYAAVCAAEAELRTDAPVAETAEPPPPGAILLERVTYRHGVGGGGVSGVTLRIEPGEIIGVAGPSGGGKTTLIDLISGLLAPQSGTITVGGVPLARSGWGATVGYVPQDGFLFHDSVRRNLSWGDPGCDDAAIHRALDVADATALVARMPRGLDTIVGERGALLSGGERQRLSIARAVLGERRLLILDEATAALDPASEATILAGLTALTPRPVILIVAHRAETLARCPRVIRVESGVVREEPVAAPVR
ncbi:ABC transporter ATP-binding protein [Sphingomonas suaedae]|uniref:ABC transporter ATP-binding protein n=1 Tax=Sphingomonas suaedae TaxID=2599297 RepID=A0A518RGV8_9SPHN|nr:ABC transporter ATP-binding protein [Sphingomonas suaedae]QDX26685.1 ABC transporter ATP-binding protein [Sphingomonas suaedae]